MIQVGRYKYQDVAEELRMLRHRAYAQDEKISPEQRPEDFTDDWDARSTVLLAFMGRRLAGSVRVIPNVNVNEIRSVHGFAGPVPIPIEGSFALGEASRLCVDPDARGRGLFWELAAEMILAASDLGI